MSPGFMSPAFMARIAWDSVVNTRAGPILRYTPSLSSSVGSMAVLLTTEPSGERLPWGKVIVLVKPHFRARSGFIITSSGSTLSFSYSNFRNLCRRSDVFHQSSISPRLLPETVTTFESSKPSCLRCSITSGTPPARKTRTVGCPTGPFGKTSTRRGTSRLIFFQSSRVGRLNPAA